MEEKKKRGRPKKSESQSLLKTVKTEKKPKKVKSDSVTKTKKVKSITKGLKKQTIQKESIAFPGIMINVDIWNKYTPIDDVNIGDEIITACGYHGFVTGKQPDHISILDTKGYGYRTVVKEAVFRLGEGKNNPDYVHEMKLRKMSKKRGNVSTIETDYEEDEYDER